MDMVFYLTVLQWRQPGSHAERDVFSKPETQGEQYMPRTEMYFIYHIYSTYNCSLLVWELLFRFLSMFSFELV